MRPAPAQKQNPWMQAAQDTSGSSGTEVASRLGGTSQVAPRNLDGTSAVDTSGMTALERYRAQNQGKQLRNRDQDERNKALRDGRPTPNNATASPEAIRAQQQASRSPQSRGGDGPIGRGVAGQMAASMRGAMGGDSRVYDQTPDYLQNPTNSIDAMMGGAMQGLGGLGELMMGDQKQSLMNRNGQAQGSMGGGRSYECYPGSNTCSIKSMMGGTQGTMTRDQIHQQNYGHAIPNQGSILNMLMR